MTIDLTEAVKQPNGSAVLDANNKPITLASSLASVISIGDSKGDAIKFWRWAVKLEEAGSLDLDEADLEKLKTYVKESNLTTMVKGPIELILTKASAET